MRKGSARKRVASFFCYWILSFLLTNSPVYHRLRNSYLYLVSASLLLSAINMIVLPPSRITGNLSIIDPLKSFDWGTLYRWFERFILFSNASFFMYMVFSVELKAFFCATQDTGHFLSLPGLNELVMNKLNSTVDRSGLLILKISWAMRQEPRLS